MEPKHHVVMGAFLFVFGGWALGLLVYLLLMATPAWDSASLIGSIVGGAITFVGIVELGIAFIGAGVLSGINGSRRTESRAPSGNS